MGGEEPAECRNVPVRKESAGDKKRAKEREEERERKGDWQTGFEIGKTVREVA